MLQVHQPHVLQLLVSALVHGLPGLRAAIAYLHRAPAWKAFKVKADGTAGAMHIILESGCFKCQAALLLTLAGKSINLATPIAHGKRPAITTKPMTLQLEHTL